MNEVRSAIGNMELRVVTARIQAVRADASRDEADLREAVAIEEVHAVVHHVGDMEHLGRRMSIVLMQKAIREACTMAGSRMGRLKHPISVRA